MTTLAMGGNAPLPADTPIVTGMYVSGAGANDATTVTAITTNSAGDIASLTLSNGKGSAAPNSQFAFSKISKVFATSGCMVFANFGVFAYKEGITNGDLQNITLNMQNQIVSALNRGVANMTPSSSDGGHNSKDWGTETNWYPKDAPQNLFSLFMHTATSAQTPIFTQPSGAVECARGATMSMAYGFAYDENPGPVPPAPTGQPEVPSKFDPAPQATASMAISLETFESS